MWVKIIKEGRHARDAISLAHSLPTLPTLWIPKQHLLYMSVNFYHECFWMPTTMAAAVMSTPFICLECLFQGTTYKTGTISELFLWTEPRDFGYHHHCAHNLLSLPWCSALLLAVNRSLRMALRVSERKRDPGWWKKRQRTEQRRMRVRECMHKSGQETWTQDCQPENINSACSH